MREILNCIIATVQKEAQARDMDYVFETSGSRNTGLSVVRFVKVSAVIDMTEDLLKLYK